MDVKERFWILLNVHLRFKWNVQLWLNGTYIFDLNGTYIYYFTQNQTIQVMQVRKQKQVRRKLTERMQAKKEST